MASRAGISSPSVLHFTVRVPGWLLLLALLTLLGWFVYHTYGGSRTSYSMARGEVFREQLDGNVWSADVLIESQDPIPRPLEGWRLDTGGGPSVPVAVASEVTQNPNFRRMVVHLFARLPEGGKPRGLQHAGFFIIGLGNDGIPVTQR